MNKLFFNNMLICFDKLTSDQNKNESTRINYYCTHVKYREFFLLWYVPSIYTFIIKQYKNNTWRFYLLTLTITLYINYINVIYLNNTYTCITVRNSFYM